MPCLLCYEMSLTLLKLRCYGFQVSIYGEHISRAYFPKWPDGLQRYFSCCFFTLLCKEQSIAEYEEYWLMGVPIINL